jgi:hypothetical protein
LIFGVPDFTIIPLLAFLSLWPVACFLHFSPELKVTMARIKHTYIHLASHFSFGVL